MKVQVCDKCLYCKPYINIEDKWKSFLCPKCSRFQRMKFSLQDFFQI